MKRLSRLLIVAALTFAPFALAEAPDAGSPGVTPAPPSLDSPTVLETGELAPTRGAFLPESKAVEVARSLKACDAERAELRKSAGLAWWVPVVIGVVGVGVGLGLGVAVKGGGK